MAGDRFSQPDGFAWGSFQNAAGANIRYGHAKPEGEIRGTLVILGGFREPSEKYFEVMREKLAQGFEVYAMDWRGQGGSDRYLPAEPMKSHHAGYDEQISTLHQFTQAVVKTDKPLIMMAHSMGAHIGLRYLKEHEGVFRAAVLTAPMLDIMTGALPRPLARQAARFARAGGYLEKYVPGGGDWVEAKDATFAGNDKTSDPDRFRAQTDAYKADPRLRMGDPTYGWVYHAFQSIDVLNKEDYLKAIRTPIVMEISGDEKIVDKKAAERAAGLLPDCKRVDIPGAKHEIWMERDALRGKWAAAAAAFLDAQAPEASPRPKKPRPHKPPRPRGPG